MQNGQGAIDPYKIDNLVSEESEILSVVVAYEDLATARRAQRLFENTSHALKAGGHGATHVAMWKIGASRLPVRMKIAADKAVTANIIVIAAHERAKVPEALQEWIGLWLPKKMEQPCGLVALLDHSQESCNQRGIYRYLKSVAYCGSFSFFANGRDEDFAEAVQTKGPCDDASGQDDSLSEQRSSCDNNLKVDRHSRYLFI